MLAAEAKCQWLGKLFDALNDGSHRSKLALLLLHRDVWVELSCGAGFCFLLYTCEMLCAQVQTVQSCQAARMQAGVKSLHCTESMGINTCLSVATLVTCRAFVHM